MAAGVAQRPGSAPGTGCRSGSGSCGRASGRRRRAAAVGGTGSHPCTAAGQPGHPGRQAQAGAAWRLGSGRRVSDTLRWRAGCRRAGQRSSPGRHRNPLSGDLAPACRQPSTSCVLAGRQPRGAQPQGRPKAGRQPPRRSLPRPPSLPRLRVAGRQQQQLRRHTRRRHLLSRAGCEARSCWRRRMRSLCGRSGPAVGGAHGTGAASWPSCIRSSGCARGGVPRLPAPQTQPPLAGPYP